MKHLIIFLLFNIHNVILGQINPSSNELFDDTQVSRIDITLPQSAIDELLDPANAYSDSLKLGVFKFTNNNVEITMDSVGIRLRGNTSRTSQKKSLKVSFNTFVPGRKFYGVEKLNLNGEHNDPSISRSKTCWDLANSFNLPASRTNHVTVYVNGEYIGVYLNVEHIDEEFVEKRYGNKDGNLYKCLYPADLNYIGNDPSLYMIDAYELKINEAENDYSDLAELIYVLNIDTPSDFKCEIESIFNVDSYINAIAFDILTGNWDGPIFNKNNFYLYKNSETGKFEYIPYDLDNTFGIDWFGIDWAERSIYEWAHQSEKRPLFSSLMKEQEYRDLLSQRIFYFIENYFNESYLYPKLDSLKDLLDGHVVNDPLYPLDYGFTITSFANAFDQAFAAPHVKYGLKNYIAKRKETCLIQLEYPDPVPTISSVTTDVNWTTDLIEIMANVNNNNSNAVVECCYNYESDQNLTCIPMNLIDEVYSVAITLDRSNQQFNYYIEVKGATTTIRYPRCEFNSIEILKSTATLAINEFMASNDLTFADEAGEYDDWIELYNYGNEDINLKSFSITDNPNNLGKWQFPDVTLAANDYLILWADEDQEQGDLHTNFKLSAGGESIGLYEIIDSNFVVIDEINFGEQETDISYGRLPNGIGPFDFLSPTPGSTNLISNTLDNAQLIYKIWPNPVRNKVNILVSESIKYNVSIYNSVGQKVINSGLKNGHANINLGALLPGVYFLELRTKTQNVVEKIVVKN